MNRFLLNTNITIDQFMHYVNQVGLSRTNRYVVRAFARASCKNLSEESLWKFLGDAESRDKFEYIDERTANIKKLQECTSHYDLCDQGSKISSLEFNVELNRK